MQALIEFQLPIFIFLGLIVFGLATYLGIIYSKLKVQEAKNKEQQKLLDKKINEQDVYFKDSIITICKATIQEQCELSEAVLRIVNILKYYPEESVVKEYKVLHEMFDEIKDFAVLEERKKISKQEAFNQDKQRMNIENKYDKEVRAALVILQKHFESLLN